MATLTSSEATNLIFVFTNVWHAWYIHCVVIVLFWCMHLLPSNYFLANCRVSPYALHMSWVCNTHYPHIINSNDCLARGLYTYMYHTQPITPYYATMHVHSNNACHLCAHIKTRQGTKLQWCTGHALGQDRSHTITKVSQPRGNPLRDVREKLPHVSSYLKHFSVHTCRCVNLFINISNSL